MSLLIEIRRDGCGTWSVGGQLPTPMSHLPSLAASIDWARTACNAAPATIELYVDGMYIVAHQERGWPKALVASEAGQTAAVAAQPDRCRAASWRRLISWLRGLRQFRQLDPLSPGLSSARLRDQTVLRR